MNLFKLLPSIFISITALLGSALPNSALNTGIVYSEKEFYGPFTKEDPETLLTFKYNKGTTYKLKKLRERLCVYKDSVMSLNLAYSSVTEAHNNPISLNVTFSHMFYPSKSFGIRGNSVLVFTVEDADTNKVYKELRVTITQKKSINFTNDDIGEVNYITNQIICLKEDQTSSGEMFDFTNFETYFKDGTYHVLRLNEIKVKYNFLTNPTQKSGIIHFKDPYNLFPNFRLYDSLSKYFEIDLISDSDGFYWEPKKLFVDPNTLMMSDVRLYGYVETKHFFFPLNTYGLYDVITFNLESEEIGLSNSNIFFSLDFYPTNTLVGDCSTSDYCIVGGVNNG